MRITLFYRCGLCYFSSLFSQHLILIPKYFMLCMIHNFKFGFWNGLWIVNFQCFNFLLVILRSYHLLFLWMYCVNNFFCITVLSLSPSDTNGYHFIDLGHSEHWRRWLLYWGLFHRWKQNILFLEQGSIEQIEVLLFWVELSYLFWVVIKLIGYQDHSRVLLDWISF